MIHVSEIQWYTGPNERWEVGQAIIELRCAAESYRDYKMGFKASLTYWLNVISKEQLYDPEVNLIEKSWNIVRNAGCDHWDPYMDQVRKRRADQEKDLIMEALNPPTDTPTKRKRM